MHLHSGAVLDRHDLLEDDVEPVRDRIRARRDERLSPADFAPLDPGQAHRDPLTRLRALDVAVVHLHAADPHVAARRLEPQPVSGCDAPDQSVPVTTVPKPGIEIERSTGSRVGPSARACSTSSPGAQLGPEVVDALAGPRADAHDLGAGHELPRLLLASSTVIRVDGVDLRQRDDAALDAEQPQDREVLVRLRPRALPRVDHEQEEVDPGRAGDHRPDESLVARDVDHARAGVRRASSSGA